MSNNKQHWLFFPEKHRNYTMLTEPVSELNPIPLLVQASSIEELFKIAHDYNETWSAGGLDEEMKITTVEKCDAATIEFLGLATPEPMLGSETDWTKQFHIIIYLPGGS